MFERKTRHFIIKRKQKEETTWKYLCGDSGTLFNCVCNMQTALLLYSVNIYLFCSRLLFVVVDVLYLFVTVFFSLHRFYVFFRCYFAFFIHRHLLIPLSPLIITELPCTALWVTLDTIKYSFIFMSNMCMCVYNVNAFRSFYFIVLLSFCFLSLSLSLQMHVLFVRYACNQL